jgi:glycosyltransferase involved in cell wall biosynthesis
MTAATTGAAPDPSSRARRVRVAVISSVHRWNDTRIFVKQAATLAANGYDVTLVAIGDQPSPFEASGVQVVPLPRRRRALRWITWLSILRIVLARRTDVVHAHDPELIPLVLLLKLTGRKAVCDIHENVAEQVLHKEWIPRFCRVPLSRLLKRAQQWLPRWADAVLLAEDSYVRDFPQVPNVSVVRNFPLLPPHFKRDYRTHTFRMIYVGDVRRVRGIREYVAIADRLAKRGVPVELRIVGSFADPNEERQTRDLVQQLGLEKRVLFLGRRPPEQVAALVECCDVGLALLHPIGNYRESYPTKMFEYMAAGVPVIASRFALWESVLVGNDCGRVVEPLDVEEATNAAIEYWESRELRERHGQNGRSAVVGHYHWGVEATQLMAVYAALSRTTPLMDSTLVSDSSTPDHAS